ncbi:MAG: polysaccharide deacetylase family protein [Huintestinicola sp.]
MYFGSVKFFKHLILTVVFGWIGVATVLAVFFGVKCYMLEKDGSKDSEAASIPENASVSEVMELLAEKGYTEDRIMEYLSDKYLSDGNAASTSDTSANTSAEIADETEPAQTEIPKDLAETAAETSAEAETSSPEELEELGELLGSMEEEDVTDGSDENYYSDSASEISELYPEITCPDKGVSKTADKKTVFLAFEDGPSANTYDILYILNRQGIKATFFVSSGNTSAELIRSAAEAGHSVGIKAVPDNGTDGSAEDYLKAFRSAYNTICDAADITPSVFTLPEDISPSVRSDVISELTRRGFEYFAPNADSCDREANASWQSIYDSSVNAIAENTADGQATVLRLHNGSADYTTVITTEDIIIFLKGEGYTFDRLEKGYEIE